MAERKAQPPHRSNGRWVFCPAVEDRPPRTLTEASARIKAGSIVVAPRTACLPSRKKSASQAAWCEHCPNKEFNVNVNVIPTKQFAWLDVLAAKVNAVFGDAFVWALIGREVLRGAPKHGDCVRVSYRMTLPDGAPMERLPYHEGENLGKLVKEVAESEAADPDLVQTVIAGKHDFCDWGWGQDGNAECWVYLELP